MEFLGKHIILMYSNVCVVFTRGNVVTEGIELGGTSNYETKYDV